MLPLLLVLCLAWACSPAAPRQEAPADLPTSSPPPATTASTSDSTGERGRIVFLGDSLTAGLGLPPEQSFPARIQERLDEEGYGLQVVNAGVSGDTSAGGLRRLQWSLDGDVRALILALGGNDGLRGLPPAELKKNLAAAINEARERDLVVLLAGMEAPPNNGPEYTARFRQVYAELAQEHDVLFVPFLLQGIAGDVALNQADGIHPNAEGAEKMADLVWATLEPALDDLRGGS